MSRKIFFWGRIDRKSNFDPENGRIEGKYFFLSNFYLAPIRLQGRVFASTEHYYQWSKFAKTDPEYAELIIAAITCTETKRLARSKDHQMDPKWDENKAKIMKEALEAKFSDHPRLRDQLIATGDAILHEDAKDDYIWGIGTKQRSGQDLLGRLLMEVREACK